MIDLLPISMEALQAEIQSAHLLIEKWKTVLETQVPGLSEYGGEAQQEALVRLLAGELRLVASKCEQLSFILMDSLQ